MSSSGQKSSVTQRCNLLSQYFKENGRFANKGIEKTMNLLPNLENSAEISSHQNVKANNFFTNIPSFASSDSKNDAVLLEQQGSSHQLTIIYAGQVFVFNDFSSEKAKEIMGLATKAAAAPSPDLNMAASSSYYSGQRSQQAAVPIARRASLHRFFEKRKDRATSRAPYQVNIPSSMAAAATKPDDDDDDDRSSKYSWMDLEGQSSLRQLDLNL